MFLKISRISSLDALEFLRRPAERRRFFLTSKTLFSSCLDLKLIAVKETTTEHTPQSRAATIRVPFQELMSMP
jgi:hypothetical protein